MNDYDIKELLKADVEGKKTFTAQWEGRCDGCGETLVEDDEFAFIGDKKKICNSCQSDIISFLES